MDIFLDYESDMPIYLQLVDKIRSAVQNGSLVSGTKLPTVREMADKIGIARGTVKHAYDKLETLGIIEMTQGRGTYVKERPQQPAGRKDQAMEAIDMLLNEMERLEFNPGETRIFFELKMREREERYDRVRIGVVDCNPEAMLSIANQLSGMPHVDVTRFMLNDILESPALLDDGFDLIITTTKHYDELKPKLPQGIRLMRIVLTASPETVLELAKVKEEAKVGIVTASERFSVIIRSGCESFCALRARPETVLLGQGRDIAGFAADKDVLILPSSYLELCNPQEEKAISSYYAAGGALIRYDYKIDRGSLLYLNEQIQSIPKK